MKKLTNYQLNIITQRTVEEVKKQIDLYNESIMTKKAVKMAESGIKRSSIYNDFKRIKYLVDEYNKVLERTEILRNSIKNIKREFNKEHTIYLHPYTYHESDIEEEDLILRRTKELLNAITIDDTKLRNLIETEIVLSGIDNLHELIRNISVNIFETLKK